MTTIVMPRSARSFANTSITSWLADDGEVAARDATMAARRKDIDKQKQALEARMVVFQARYLKQFNALDSLLTQMQSTSSYLTQQLSNIPGIN